MVLLSEGNQTRSRHPAQCPTPSCIEGRKASSGLESLCSNVTRSCHVWLIPRANIWEACVMIWGRGYYFLNHCHHCALCFFFSLKCHWIQFEHKCCSSSEKPLCFLTWKLFHAKALLHSSDIELRWTHWEITPCRTKSFCTICSSFVFFL